MADVCGALGALASVSKASKDDLRQALFFHDFKLQSENMQEGMLIDLASRYNFLQESRGCCAWHAMLHHLHDLVHRLQQTKCRPDFSRAPHNVQCPECGLLDTHDFDEQSVWLCEYCGFCMQEAPMIQV